jgi:DNA-directed RNA polymerase I subunit RPA49
MRVAPTPAVPANALWKAKRNDLGETFGTRKAKSQIRADERNKVDISAMASVRGTLIDSIGGMEAVEGELKR